MLTSINNYLLSLSLVMQSSLNHLCDRWDVLIAPPEKPTKRHEIIRTVDIELEEVDTGSPDRYIYIYMYYVYIHIHHIYQLI